MKKPWIQYIEDVEKGKITAGQSIKEAIKRFRDFEQREDIYFDTEAIDECISFFPNLTHFKGSTAGQAFELMPWQTFVLADIFGWKYKDTGLRVAREIYLQISRKGGKSSWLAAIALYMLIAEGEASPEICAAANSTDQARILFEYITKFAKQLDPSGTVLKPYRNSLKGLGNDGVVKVISSDSSRADGMNISLAMIDEYHEAKDRKMYDVLRSSQGQRSQPLTVVITTAGFNLTSPCHDLYKLAHEILAGVKTQDNFRAYIFEMDADDDINDEKNWYKCQPNLDVTVTKDFMREELQKAENDSTARTGVLTKTFNKWCSSRNEWLDQSLIARLMEKLELENYAGKQCIIGCDLSSTGDFTAISAMFPPETTEGKYAFFNWVFFPQGSLEGHPWKVLYEKFIEELVMLITPSNVTDYDYIYGMIQKINSICPVQSIWLDRWNASQFQIQLTEGGFNVQEYSQTIANYNNPTKEFERLAKLDKLVIDKSSCVLWQFGNCLLKTDLSNGNVKPSKQSAKNKIDSIIAMTTALGGHLKNPVNTDFEIFVV